MASGARGRIQRLSIAVAALLAGLALAETALRGLGYYWPHAEHRNEPAMHEPDPDLGWRSKAGRYVFAAYQAGLPAIRMTFLPDGTRASSDSPPDGPDLVVLGCSFTAGWALDDEHTYPWKLQTRLPSLRVLNYGTAGYGTHQALLALEAHLRRSPRPPELVLYGLVQHHQLRNVGDPQWLMMLAFSARRGHAAVPHSLLKPDGSLERRPPETYPAAWLDKASAVAALARAVHGRAVRRERVLQAGPVTERLLVEMDAAARRAGSRLAVALLDLDPGPRAHYARFLKERGVAAFDCAGLPLRDPAFQVPGEGHPNGPANEHWARCIEAGLRREFPSIARRG